MQILYDSKKQIFKSKFGTLRENEGCTINIHVPKCYNAVSCNLVFNRENGTMYSLYSMLRTSENGEYDVYSCTFSFAEAGLYFYKFDIKTEHDQFSLYKCGYDGTNIREGGMWQISCIPSDFEAPKEFMGTIMYQIFPDRFCKVGCVDTEEKLKPFWVHKDTSEVPCFWPDEKGVVQNNDFFGGNLKGITSKLDYLKSLNVGVIYLNPIFKAFSNHRYDTADYMKIDEMLGDEKDFSNLCKQAHKRGIKIILDGVFSHVGSNSKYFDCENVFGNGAVSNEKSPYRCWFDFKNYPNDYTSWWGIKTLPCVDENNKEYRDYIINDDDSVIAHWLNLGADGFRLDVADELPDSFIFELRNRLKKIKKDSFLIGEVWEDASNKCSYGIRRKYFTGGELDSVMNYPFKNAIIDYVCGRDNGYGLRDTVMTISENYPSSVLNCLMNVLSTHDTVRVLTALGDIAVPSEKEQRAYYKMSESDLKLAKERLFCAVLLQFILPGMPCIYYSDEIGTEGFEDPFCRTFFDWSRVDNNDILDFYKNITKIKSSYDEVKYGDVEISVLSDNVVSIKRTYCGKTVSAIINTGNYSYDASINGKILLSRNAKIDSEKNIIEKNGFILHL
ncbi:MAG: glycoside hydrolase family 13 protein [Ruminococcaceae bacterium]|nr:glycoside hydrolase family 13 protein [Oscillospiraceae bacterium]